MNEANANRTVNYFARTIAHARIRDRPKQELTFPLSLLTLGNYSAQRPPPRLPVRDQFKVVELSHRESSHWFEMNSEVLESAGELTSFLSFNALWLCKVFALLSRAWPLLRFA
ncbi:hypothetical protein [Mesorhizobium sp.]|uniref:hypothetical protein n=1 Tax=Mesorhizobium sp. TaxID=1871066 RepID=UPI000FE463D3|nr:hypothetical protein [Mesorhizobium sp.]RWQ61951.1 MAG: hypothetical protein EOS86_32510 [Mesorhizobium sp.]